jgi:hypothetical protein
MTMYASSPLRMTRTHLRRLFPVRRPVVVSTPNPAGGRARKNGSMSALSARPPLAERVKGLRWRSRIDASAAAESLPGSDASALLLLGVVTWLARVAVHAVLIAPP